MKQDTIFYQLFKRSPTLLYELLANYPPQATEYRFDSIEVKETAFRADGVFLPPTPAGNIYFGEVQQAKDDLLYERLLAEIGIFAYRERDSFKDWRAVVIYPTHDIEQKRLDLVQEFLASGRITRIYLDELGEIEDLPWGLALMVLTILPSGEMVTAARGLLQRSETSTEGSAILDLVVTAIVYKFNELTRDEVNTMLGIELKKTRVIQEAQTEKAAAIALRLIAQKLGALDVAIISQINTLGVDQLDCLLDGVITFESMSDLQTFLINLEHQIY